MDENKFNKDILNNVIGKLECIRDTLAPSMRSDLDVAIFVMKDSLDNFEEMESEMKRRSDELDDKIKKGTIDLIIKNEELINKNRQLEAAFEELHGLEKMKMEFMMSLSHEVRTPMTSILGFSKILKKQYDTLKEQVLAEIKSGETIKTLDKMNMGFEIIISEGNRLYEILNDILEYFSIISGNSIWNNSLYDAKEIVEEGITGLKEKAAKKGLEFSVLIEEDLPRLNVDKKKASKIVANLLSNAIKFTSEGSIALRVFRNGMNIKFAVEDTGKGVSDKEKAYLFTKFIQGGDVLTAKPSGTGLGLATAKAILANYNGKIWMEERKGGGSIFYFYIPYIANC